MIVFEDRSTYDAKADSVATVTLTVECAPGQVANLSDFLVGAAAKAGVYSVTMDHVVAIPEPEGEVHGEQPLQYADPDGAGEDHGRRGEEASAGWIEGSGDAGADSVVARASWEVGS